MDLFAAVCENSGLIIDMEKTKVMHQPLPDVAYGADKINVNGAQLPFVDAFSYIGGTCIRNTKIDNEVPRRISKATQAFGRLQNTVRNRHGPQLSTKLMMYRAVILPTLRYRAETCTVYKERTRRLSHFHLNCCRRILKLRWRDGIPDRNVLEQTGILGIYAMLRQLQLRWSGHLVRIGNERLRVPADKEAKSVNTCTL
ncbi:hypothetical protein SprV_0401692500 [Sparganum proliferum]